MNYIQVCSLQEWGEKVELPKHPLKGKWRNNMVSIKGFLDRTENKQTKSIPSSWINLKKEIWGEKKIKWWQNSYSFILYINTSSSKTWKIKWSNAWWGNFLLVKATQLCPALCNSMDYSLPGSSVHGILQARILEWVAIPFSMGSSQPRDWTWVSCTSSRLFPVWVTRDSL